jgi:translation initiation factor 1
VVGETVTVVKNFIGIGLPEKEQLAKAMQKGLRHGRHRKERADRDSGD